MLKTVRISVKVMLLISIIIAFALASTYLVNLRPDMDGFWVNTMVARWIYGDNGWSFNLLYNGFLRSMLATIVLFLINTGLDIYVMSNWGFGENNCGNETNLSVKGDIQRDGSVITSKKKDFLLDIVGRYIVTIAGKSYDTVCVVDIETYNPKVVSEQYLDKNGRTILWRRFNRDDWAIDHYKKLWSELLPENERITVNGVTYVHWYDCVTDYIF